MEQAPDMMPYGTVSKENALWNRLLGGSYMEQASEMMMYGIDT